MAEEEIENEESLEREQMKRLQTLRRIVGTITRRYVWLLVVAGCVAFASVFGLMSTKVRRSMNRYESTTSLIYTPREAGKIRVMDAQEVLHVLTRRSILHKLVDALQLSPKEGERLGLDITLVQPRQPKNMYNLTVRAPTPEGAVKKVNAFAELCMKEYIAYRMADLESWMETILVRKREIEDQIARNEELATQLSRKHGVSSPEAEADRLTRAMDDRRQALIEVRLRTASAELKKKKTENELKSISPRVSEHADAIKFFLDRRRRNEAELAEVLCQYSESNPKYRNLKARRDVDEAELQAFLKANGISDTDGLSLGRYAALQDELKEAVAQLDLGRETASALERECERLSKQLEGLVAVLPDFDRLKSQRKTLRLTLDGIEETISNIRYLESTCGADLTQIESAQGAGGDSPYGKKTMMLSVLAAAAVIFALLVTVLLLELQFGVVSGPKEVAFHGEIRPLGALPFADEFANENEARNVNDGIFYRFRRECTSGTIFLGQLPGSAWSRKLDTSFGWNFAMGGARRITVQIVKAFDFVEPKNAEFLGGIVMSGDEAWMPVTDSTALSPGEMELLQMDLKKLREDYAEVFIRRKEPLKHGEIFLSQMATLCDRTLLFIGARRTRRRQLQQALEAIRAVKDAEILAVTTSVKSVDELKEGNFR